jgi:hypothetical protein
MVIKLTNMDQGKLDEFLGSILDWYASGDVSKSAAIGALAHVFTAAAVDNASEVQSWLHKPVVLEEWKRNAEKGAAQR